MKNNFKVKSKALLTVLAMLLSNFVIFSYSTLAVTLQEEVVSKGPLDIEGVEGYWKFDEESTESGFKNEISDYEMCVGQSVGPIIAGARGKYKNAVNFPKENAEASITTGNYVRIDKTGYPDVYNPETGSMSVSVWFKRTSEGATQYGMIVNKMQAVYTLGWGIQAHSFARGAEKFGIRAYAFPEAPTDSNGSLTRIMYTSSNIEDNMLTYNEWHHVVLVINRDAGEEFPPQVSVYIDGRLDNPSEIEQTPNWKPGASISNPAEIRIGNAGGELPNALPDKIRNFVGSIDELSIFNKALSQTEINSIYNYEEKDDGGSEPVDPNEALFNAVEKDGGMLIRGYTGTETTVNIPSVISGLPVTEISSDAFKGNTSITEVVIPNTVKTIGNISLNTLNEDVTPSGAFESCVGLKRVTLSSELTLIGSRTFYGCTKLELLIIPKNVVKIGAYAFSGCNSLQSLAFGDKLEQIGEYALSNNTGLKEVKFGNKIKVLGSYLFSACDNLTNVTLGNALTELPIGLFYECTSLNKISIPINVKKINAFAFYGCKNLNNVVLLYNVTSIGNSAFEGCSGLKRIDISNSVSDISIDSFAGHSSDLTIYCLAGTYAYNYAVDNKIKVNGVLINTEVLQSEENTESENGLKTEIEVSYIKDLISKTPDDIVYLDLLGAQVIKKEIFKEIAAAGKKIAIKVFSSNDKSEDNLLSAWVFSSINNTDVDLDLSMNSTTENLDDINKIISTSSKIIMSFNQNGVLPGEAEVIFRNTYSLQNTNKQLLYFYNKDKKELEKVESPVMMTSDGKYVSFKIKHCSDYIITDYKIPSSTVSKALPIEQTQNNSNSLLIFIVVGILLLLILGVLALYYIKKKNKN